MVSQDRIEKKPGQHNNHIVLVSYPERIEASISKWRAAQLKVTREMFDLANDMEVSQWFRLTLNLRALNRRTKFQRFPLPRVDDSLANKMSGR